MMITSQVLYVVTRIINNEQNIFSTSEETVEFLSKVSSSKYVVRVYVMHGMIAKIPENSDCLKEKLDELAGMDGIDLVDTIVLPDDPDAPVVELNEIVKKYENSKNNA